MWVCVDGRWRPAALAGVPGGDLGGYFVPAHTCSGVPAPTDAEVEAALERMQHPPEGVLPFPVDNRSGAP